MNKSREKTLKLIEMGHMLQKLKFFLQKGKKRGDSDIFLINREIKQLEREIMQKINAK